MTKRTYFRDSDKAAREGTEKLIRWLRADNHWVSNLEKQKYFQELDIDLYAYRRDKGPSWLEIKVDSYSGSGNLFLEVVGNTNLNTPGCIYMTKSDSIYYFFDSSNELFILPTVQLQGWLRANEHRFKRIEVATTDEKKRHWYNTIGVLVTKSIVLHEVPGAYKLFLPHVC